ncbi:unnamed protein product, partial [Staurois parvus]
RVGSKRANKVPGAGGRVVRTIRGQYRQSSCRIRYRQSSCRIRVEASRIRIPGPSETVQQGTDCRSGHSLNIPPAISLR